jgi:tetratricopeptide (TPR) repeat protein
MQRLTARLLVPALVAAIVVAAFVTCGGAAETCEEWVARVVSVQGRVQALRIGQVRWLPVALDDRYCAGDVIWVQEQSRAAVVLRNDAILRLDQNTAITFTPVEEEEQSFWIKLIKGAAHFFSRTPRSLRVATPFVNGAGEGTEFFVRVGPDEAFVSVFEGRVAVTNEAGGLLLKSGESALARADQPPRPEVVVRPRDAVQWALYYPPVVDYRPADFAGGAENGWEEMVRHSLEFYWKGDLARAFAGLEGAPEDLRDPRFFTYRAALLLSVGRVEEANREIERALKLYPSYSQALALQAVIAVAQNRKETALELAKKAVDLAPQAAVARVALSYAQQASFDLNGALASLQEAVKLGPHNALAWARLAELWLSFGYLDRALEAARTAVSLDPDLARTQSVLGFAHLTQIEIEGAKRAFHRAIGLDQGDPLPRLGLGLAKIREGDLPAGRAEIEIAASLDPSNSLIRSYLGKAYFDEKRTRLDGTQYAVAKELDPLDPTPYFYDAILKQTTNRPVAALQDLQKSIALNDNRAVYRSRLLLDQDLAARSAGLGMIFRNLGFGKLALVEGWKSVNTDPGNFSAHRLLADLYSTAPRHEIARVSELLQSQLLQPLNINPIQPQLAQSNLFFLEGLGPSQPSFNDYYPLFTRNRLAFQADGVVGNHGILGEDLVQSAVWGKASYSLGQFHYESNGFRQNNDLDEDIYDAFLQTSLTYKTSVQAELRYIDVNNGDLPIRFDPDNYHADQRQEDTVHLARIGFHHAFTPGSDLISSLIYQDSDAKFTFGQDLTADFGPPFGVQRGKYDLEAKGDDKGYLFELGHLLRSERFRLTSGGGYFRADRDEKETETTDFPAVFTDTSTTKDDSTIHHTNLYGYSLMNYPESITWTIGASADFFDGFVERNQFNPKLGVTWAPFAAMTLRGAVFRVLKRSLIADQTIEPTQVAGFNQFFDDGEGTESWLYGIALDERFSETVYGGIECARRDLETPYKDETLDEVHSVDWHEKWARAYLSWALHPWAVASGEYGYERFDRDSDNPGPDLFTEITTHRLSLGANFYHPSGARAGLKETFVDQEGDFVGSDGVTITHGSDHFWVLDAAIGYQLPRRLGLITMEARNLLDEKFKFEDADPANPSIAPDRVLLLKVTLAL